MGRLADVKQYANFRRELGAIGPTLDHLEWAVLEIEQLRSKLVFAISENGLDCSRTAFDKRYEAAEVSKLKEGK